MAKKPSTTPPPPEPPFWQKNRRELTFLILFALLLGGSFTLISVNWVNDHVIEPFTGGIARVSGATLDLLGQDVRMQGTIIRGSRYSRGHSEVGSTAR